MAAHLTTAIAGKRAPTAMVPWDRSAVLDPVGAQEQRDSAMASCLAAFGSSCDDLGVQEMAAHLTTAIAGKRAPTAMVPWDRSAFLDPVGAQVLWLGDGVLSGTPPSQLSAAPATTWVFLQE